jgi:hypothetical protein
MLYESEMELARRIADIRNSKKDLVQSRRRAKEKTDWEIHYDGARAEIAVCKYFHYLPDIHFMLGGDKGAPDLYIGHQSVEVKTATWDPPIAKLDALPLLKVAQHG